MTLGELEPRSREALAWAAGFFEGEGCFSWNARGRAMSASIGSTDLDRLEEFQRVVGVGRIYPCKRLPSHKPLWTWHSSGFEPIQAIAAMLWAWLGPRRRTRATEILRLGRNTRLPAHLRIECPQGHPYDSANTYVSKTDGSRTCRACNREKARARYRAMKNPPKCMVCAGHGTFRTVATAWDDTTTERWFCAGHRPRARKITVTVIDVKGAFSGG